MKPIDIKVKLLRLNISQSEIARALNTSQSAISYVINGKRTSKRIKSFIEEICRTGRMPQSMRKAA